MICLFNSENDWQVIPLHCPWGWGPDHPAPLITISHSLVLPPLRDHSDADDSIWCRWPSHWQCPPAVQHPSADAWQTISQHVLHRSWERRHCHRGVTCAAGPGGKLKGLCVFSFMSIEHGSHRRKCVGSKGGRNRQGRNEMFAHGWVVKSPKINGARMWPSQTLRGWGALVISSLSTWWPILLLFRL